ncbi:MAG: diversity-generating retroelement protein Avd [Pseudomonadota bacterium]
MDKPSPANRQNNEDLPVFVKWMDFLEWLLPVLEKFPKRVRFTFCDRMTELALDIVEDLVEARYSARRREHLRQVNLRLEKLRVLLRICHRLQYLDHKRYEHAMTAINEVGRMIGGWLKQSGNGAA